MADLQCRQVMSGRRSDMDRGQREMVVLDAPSNLGLRPPAPGREPGVWRLSAALRGHEVVTRLGAADGGAVPPPPYAPDAEAETGFRNGAAIARYSARLAARLVEIVGAEQFPLVLGGD